MQTGGINWICKIFGIIFMQILAQLEKISSNAIGSALGLKITTNLTSLQDPNQRSVLRSTSVNYIIFAPTPSLTVWLLDNTGNFTTLRLPREFHLHQRWFNLSKGKTKNGKVNIYMYIYTYIFILFSKASTEAIFKCRFFALGLLRKIR